MTTAQLRNAGQRSWLNRLNRAGRLEEAAAFARRYRLDPLTGLPLQRKPKQAAEGTAAAATGSAALLPSVASVLSVAPASPATAASAVSASTAKAVGGEGVNSQVAGVNLDQSPPRARNPQSGFAGEGRVGRVVSSAAASSTVASPSGEVEGKSTLGQANNEEMEGWWPQEGVGVVGVNCRNRFYCEVRVAGKWAKAAKGGRVLWNGERVRVKLVWVSADGRDAEYEVVEKVEEQGAGQPEQAKPVGYREQGNVGVYHAEVVKGPEVVPEGLKQPLAAFQTAAPQSLGFQQLAVPVIHDQPKLVVFQTTTMEQLVAKENVGTLHASGKTGPAPRHEDFRSPVLDDIPAPPVAMD